ncbi:MAG: glycerophosphodiester phosphodiesterase family protein [Boseongicola sp.]
MSLPASFLTRPFAHRGLHDVADGRPENSLVAARAAIANGYGIELDVQITADAEAVVFHDYELDRLTEATGIVRRRTLADLRKVRLKGGSEGIPSLSEFLAVVAGQVPILLEIKDQDGALGKDVGPLERAVAKTIGGYRGDVAVMSFNPHSVAAMKALSPECQRGLVTEAFPAQGWAASEPVLQRLREIPDYVRTGSVFISHQVSDLSRPRVAELRQGGATVICWTVRSPEEERAARLMSDNVTFEGYLA